MEEIRGQNEVFGADKSAPDMARDAAAARASKMGTSTFADPMTELDLARDKARVLSDMARTSSMQALGSARAGLMTACCTLIVSAFTMADAFWGNGADAWDLVPQSTLLALCVYSLCRTRRDRKEADMLARQADLARAEYDKTAAKFHAQLDSELDSMFR